MYLNETNELDVYIELMDLELKHPHFIRIPLYDGELISEEKEYSVYAFEIGWNEYRELEAIQWNYSFKFRDEVYPCSILDLTKEWVKLGIEKLKEKRIGEGTIVVDMSFITKRKKWGLTKLKKEEFYDKRCFLFGEKGITPSLNLVDKCIFENKDLNSDQKRAIGYAVGVRDVYLIWGPPGTGKTTVVPEIVSNYIRLHRRSNPKILICAYTNTAVDNIVKKLSKFKIVRFGSSMLNEEFKELLFSHQLEEKRTKIEKECEKTVKSMIQEKKNLEAQINSITKDIEKFNKKQRDIKKKIEELNKEIFKIEEQILTKILQELRVRKKRLTAEVKKIETDIRKLNRNLFDIRRELDRLKRKEAETVEIIHIITHYIEFAKKNRIIAFFQKRKFERQNPLYKKYKAEITRLKLSEMGYKELKSVYQEKLREQEEKKRNITKIEDYSNALEREKEDKRNKLMHVKEEIGFLEKKYENLSMKHGGSKEKLLRISSKEILLVKNALEKEITDLKRFYDDKKQKEKDLEEIKEKSESLKRDREKIEMRKEELNNRIKILEEKKREKIEKIGKNILNENQIIATTNLRVYDPLFDDIDFDFVIMDEAGAVDLPGAVIPFLKGKKLVLLGDHNQIPPIIRDSPREIKKFVERHPKVRESIFERFVNRIQNPSQEDKIIMLRSQYRMKKEIADFVSLFYKKPLNTPKKIEGRLKHQDEIVGDRYPMICFPRKFWSERLGESIFSLREIEFIKNLIENFKKTYGDEIKKDIAIISPFRAQINKIKEIIPDVECGTVHTYQGQEKKVIIYATTKYQVDKDRGFGPLFDGKRGENLLNVAVSRAKEKFIIIGSKELFKEVDVYKKLYEHIKKCGYVAEKYIEGYDIKTQCETCGEIISGRSRYCKDCLELNRLRKFLEEKPRNYKAEDGHLLRSSDEVRIDDWFYHNGIEHQVEIKVPVNKLMYCDWFLPGEKIYVEYWGLMDKKTYKKARMIKENLYRESNLKLISIEPEDMRNLEETLRYKFKKTLKKPTHFQTSY
ncbi:MAG: AAA domain-containing protein [Candidatus Syntropharchaeia archaeon]